MPPEIEQSMASFNKHQLPAQTKNNNITTTTSASKISIETSKRTVVPTLPSKLVIHPVSKLDSVLGNFYLHTVLFFDRSTSPSVIPWDKEEEDLNYSLAKALDLFPVLSGRLRLTENGKLGIKSNDAGVRLSRAASECTLHEWLDATDGLLHRDVFPEVRVTDYTVSPLLTIQYTSFRCGSLAIGLSLCHLVGDFTSLGMFVKVWGHAHGNSGKVPFTPSLKVDKPAERSLPEQLSAEEGMDINVKVPSELDSYVFHFASGTIEKLTRESGCSDVDGLSAFLWRSVVKAQQQGGSSESPSRLCMWWNSGPEKATYFGNGDTAFKVVDITSGELVTQSIKEVAKCVQLGGRVNGSSNCSIFARNVLFCNWAAEVPLYEVEFGFSSPRPMYAEACTAALLGEATVTVFPAAGGGKSVCVSLQREAMKRLLQDSGFVNATGSIQRTLNTTQRAPAV